MGFDGLVLTDWGATVDRVAGILAGCDLEMPGQVAHNRRELLDSAARDPRVVDALARSAGRVLDLVAKHPESPGGQAWFDLADHEALSEQIAREGAVLMANDGALPLAPSAEGLVVVGELFEHMRFQGAGSSLITPPSVVSPRQAFDRRGIAYRYAPGYRSFDGTTTPHLRDEALAAVGDASTVLFFGGLTDFEESEGFDRTHLRLGAAQLELLGAILDRGARVVLVLFAGASVELPMAARLAAVLNMNLPGMRGGEATAALLFGETNPSGKLAESWVRRLEDSSPFADYNRGALARYYESIYVGYRFHDASGTDLAYPFGHGLSYTTYEYRDLRVTVDDAGVTARLTVRNAGAVDGDEVVQLYVASRSSAVFMPAKELRGFARVHVPAGGARDVTISFPLSELSYWDVAQAGWVLENGEYEVMAAASASDIRLRAPLQLTGHATSRSPYPAEVDVAYAAPPREVPAAFETLVGAPIVDDYDARRLTLNTRLGDARRTVVGRLVSWAIIGTVGKDYRAALALPPSLERDAQVKNTYFVWRMMPNSLLRSMAMSSAGAFPYELAEALSRLATGHPIRAIRSLRAWRERKRGDRQAVERGSSRTK